MLAWHSSTFTADQCTFSVLTGLLFLLCPREASGELLSAELMCALSNAAGHWHD